VISLLAADKIPGMMPAPQMSWFATEASTRQKVVEVGCWRGRTTRALCDNCPGRVWAIDTFEGSDELLEELSFMREITGDQDWLFNEFKLNTAGCTNLTVLRGSSIDGAALFLDRGLDMVILDASHDYDSVVADITAWWPKITLGGLLCGHDFTCPDVKRAVDKCFPGFPPPAEDCNLWAVYRGELK